ncbi:MAG TPA: hypothetical protein VJ938_06440 [Acidimicrobiia bacterium]|nr:hypothetical protein [Acidimicrobiia bacterium]
MTDVTPADLLASSQEADADEAAATGPKVVVAVTVVAGVDPQQTLEAVRRQARPPVSVMLVGGSTSGVPDGVVLSADLEELVAGLDAAIDYVWILHGDAEPRPDAMGALVDEAERHEASLTGSKLLVGGTRDTLEGVGSATDIFGEPYSGLDEGEVDLEQYDVVRDVAFVNSVSMLVRRDLLRGLGGLDEALAPVASGLDLSQRVRIAGGSVMVVPSSEVFHMRRCGRGDGGWREQSGRMRAMLKAYRPVTLIWMVPFAIFTGLLDSLGSLLLGRWRLIPRYVLTWGWNLGHLPSTIAARRRLSRVRQVGDEELFRYQVRGSVRLRHVGSELSERILGVFDEDRALTKRASQVWSSAGTWGALAALALVLVGLRAVFLGPLPAVGYALPLDEEPLTSLARVLGGWNAAGLGTDAPVHPAVGPASTLQMILFGNGVLARSVLTVAAFGAGVVGVGRLASRLRTGGAGAYLGGAAAMFGLPAALLGAEGHWAALIGLGVLPWALLTVVGPPPPGRRQWWAAWGRATLAVGLTALFVPALAVGPLLFALVLKLLGRFQVRLGIALTASVGGLAALPYLLANQDRLIGGIPLDTTLGVVPGLALVVAVLAGMVAGSWRVSALAGGLVFGGLTLTRFTGPELQVALLAFAAVGVGLAVAAAMRRRDARGVPGWLALGGGAALLVVSLAGVAGGRGGLPADAWREGLEFTGLDSTGVERALLVAAEPTLLPGESQPGPGFWFRLVTSDGATLDQATLGPTGSGDAALRQVIGTLAAGGSLEPGALLAPFGVRWIVAVGDAAIDLAPVLDAQVDLDPLPVSEGLVVYENTAAASVAETEAGTAWVRDGTGFAGSPSDDRVRLSLQGDGRWQPDWQADDWAGTVSGAEGVTGFSGANGTRLIVAAGAVILLAAAVVAGWLRRAPRP